MTLSRIPLDNLPSGSVKIPLALPRGAAWPIVAQIAALSQRASGCTASIAFLADQSGLSASSVYAALAAAGSWIVTRGRARWLAPLPPQVAWARISYRAAAAVGCRQVDGVWTARRNRSLLLQLYCFLRRDEDAGRLRSQAQLAQDLEVSISATKNLLRTLANDGWISCRPEGRRLRYFTHDSPHLPEADKIGPGLLTRNDQDGSPETIKAADRTQKHDDQTRGEKQDDPPLAAGDVPHRKNAPGGALPRERRIHHSPDAGPPPIRVLGALSAMTALPTEWLARMTERDRERVLAAIEAEISKGRTIAQMTARIRRRLLPWYGVSPRRPEATALTIVRRGYACPRADCEDHLLPSGHPCGACAEIGAEVNQRRLERTSPVLPHGTTTENATSPAYARPRVTEPRHRPRRVDAPAVARVDAGGPDGPAARARALLMATSPKFAAAQRRARRAPMAAVG
ncbi:hypothetical protein HD597_000033 [Nonomuraea thailandensis]|uniref:Uncharacterized protein n=1 Tax=Nonomuraea thailandensis TaxID=1188745 RepID=A0A9X2GE42_9ACTN|nr:hypothetical protein [Nonomuraea thailandensis]MCP2353013.1 hypothetical protein [Nonomuraea thailandensis]